MIVVASQTGRRGSVTLPWRSLLLTMGALMLWWTCGPAPDAWVFDRVAIAGGEWWRLLTAHWVHGDGAHAAWDIAMLLALGALFEAKLRWRLPLVLLGATLTVDAWLWWGLPQLRFYCGLSGILNGLLALGMLSLWRDMRHPVVMLTLVAAGAKIAVETFTGQALLTQTAWPSVPSAHAAGFLCGMWLASVTLRE